MAHNDQHLDRAKTLALKHYNSRLPEGIPKIRQENVYVVSFTYILGNWKALVSTDVDGDTTYYEITHNAKKSETYIDCYTKVDNVAVPDTVFNTPGPTYLHN